MNTIKIAGVEERLGKIKYNSHGTPMKIIAYKNAGDITIEFQDENKHIMNTTYSNFNRGFIENPFDRKVFNHGYIGVGKYKPKENLVLNVMYQTWRDMLVRCYYKHKKDNNKAYYGICTVCEEWLNYQNFAKWYEDNVYPLEERIHVDKDILNKGNKIYSPDNCLLVPQRINMIFMSKKKKIDADLPNAIYRCVKGYKAAFNGKSLGVFKTLEEAIENKDKMKRIHIRKVIDEYKNILPEKVVNALLNW